mmetsp:Transcript_5612/g.13905  ORF Transcript_5612/g.13905 Transcript_5612/m.13905 type:complete len:246 (-) Transcript_5612:117-854(-)
MNAPQLSVSWPSFTLFTRFLYYRFRSDRWYWGSVLMVRSFLIAMVPIVSPDNGNVQVLMLMSVAGVFMLAQALILPWKTYLLNAADTAVLLMLVLIGAAASAFTEQENSDSSFTTFILLIFSAGFLTVLIVLGHAVVGACAAARGKRPLAVADLEGTTTDFVTCIKALGYLNEQSVAQMLGSLGYFDRLAIKQFLAMMNHELHVGIRHGSRRISISDRKLKDVRSQLQETRTLSTTAETPGQVDL